MKTKKGKKKKKNKPPHIPKEQTASRNPARSTDADSRDYAGNLRGIMATWRVLVLEARKQAESSISELVRERGPSGEEPRPALHALKSTVIGFGIRLSRIIVEYFAVIWRCNSKDVWVKTRNAVNTIRVASLEGGNEEPSAIISGFVASIESIDFDSEEKRHLCNESGCYCISREDEVRVSETENKILGTIFFKILFLEILFDMPFLSGAAGKEDCAARISEFVAKESGFEEKLRSLESEIDRWKEAEIRDKGIEFRGENLETKRATIGFRIEEIWKSLY